MKRFWTSTAPVFINTHRQENERTVLHFFVGWTNAKFSAITREEIISFITKMSSNKRQYQKIKNAVQMKNVQKKLQEESCKAIRIKEDGDPNENRLRLQQACISFRDLQQACSRPAFDPQIICTPAD